MTLRFGSIGSLFAGIGGFDLGFERAGFHTVWQVEIDQDCQSVLRLRFPDAVRYLDVREVGARNLEPVDIITFGSPCQDLSVAGKRAGLSGERSGLFYEAVRIVSELRPSLVLWENVPGAFSSHSGRDFYTVLLSLRECGARDIAWRTFDSQYFGLAQRRKRIFLIADFGGERAAEILFEPPGLCRHIAPRREEGQRVIRSLTGGTGSSSCGNPDDAVLVPETVGSLAPNSGPRSHDAGNFHCNQAVDAGYIIPAVAFTERTRSEGRTFECQEELAYALTNPGNGGRTHSRTVAGTFGVRRLMPVECERLQGFPDGWTSIGLDEKGNERRLSDSSRYRMLGNAVSVPVAEWIAKRIAGRV